MKQAGCRDDAATGLAGGQLLKLRQSHADDLVHVVVAIRGEAADEADVFFLFGQLGVLAVKRLRGGGGDGVVRFAVADVIGGIFADNGRVFAALAGGVLDLDDAGEVVVVGIIHLHCRLPETGFAGDRFALFELRGIEGLVLEIERAIREPAEFGIEKLVDRSGVDHVLAADVREQFAIIGAEQHADIW